MKYCINCGKECVDEAVICPGCGCAFPQTQNNNYNPKTSSNDGFKTAAKILMLIGAILNGFYILPLAWCIPMTVSYWNKVKNNEPVGTAFKICSLLFVSLLGGIFMLIDKD